MAISKGFNLPQNTSYNDPNLEKGFSNISQKSFDIGKTNRPTRPNLPQLPGTTQQLQPQTNYVPGTPTSLSKLPVTTPYKGSTRYESVHRALDLAAPTGTLFESLSPGIVKNVVSGKKQGDKAFGNYILVEDPSGKQFRYSHLNQSYVPVGTEVKRGDIIGTIGNTGQTYSLHGGSGSHLDLRIFDAAKNIFVDPTPYL